MVISWVPLELSDVEIQQGLVEDSRSLLEPQFHEIMKAMRVQQLKRQQVSAEDPTKSSWVLGKSVRVIFQQMNFDKSFSVWGITSVLAVRSHQGVCSTDLLLLHL